MTDFRVNVVARILKYVYSAQLSLDCSTIAEAGINTVRFIAFQTDWKLAILNHKSIKLPNTKLFSLPALINNENLPVALKLSKYGFKSSGVA